MEGEGEGEEDQKRKEPKQGFRPKPLRNRKDSKRLKAVSCEFRNSKILNKDQRNPQLVFLNINPTGPQDFPRRHR